MNTISIILVVYMGVHAGKILLLYYQCNARVVRWLLWSSATVSSNLFSLNMNTTERRYIICINNRYFDIQGIIAGLLCHFDKESGVIPVSKKMMSLSFILTVSCFAFLLYAILHFLIDYKQYWNGTPFIYAGL